jgi:nucleotide-binding universal stress UspA family protein
MTSLVIAVDGSAPSLKGVEHGCALAKAMGFEVELVCVSPPVLLPPAAYADTIAKIEEANALQANETLARAEKIAASFGVKSSRVVLNGAPAEAIADLALASRVWGVVVGAKGHSALSRVMLGSVADRLVHISSKPVLVVR